MGNRNQPFHYEEEVEPILSNAFSGIQTNDNEYGSVNGDTDDTPIRQNGQPPPRSYVLKTEQRREDRGQRLPFVVKHANSREGGEERREGSGHHEVESHRRQAMAHRLRYFSRLDRRPDSSLAMPDHVVPHDFWDYVVGPPEIKQSSIVTIFALWNTMMGTSLLSMPWAIQQAGFVGAIVLLVGMGLIMFYTSYLVLKSVNLEPGRKFSEFADVCGFFLGRFSRSLATFSSLVTLLGGMIVYWILLSNFLYNIVVFIYNKTQHIPFKNLTDTSLSDLHSSASHLFSDSTGFSANSSGVVCPSSHTSTASTNGTSTSTFDKVWTEDLTVPIVLCVPLILLVNFKSATIFTKLNSFGVVSVLYLLIFTVIKASEWGINLHLGASTVAPAGDPHYSADIKTTFPALTGICALAYFVQNCVLAITRNNRYPENNVRDLSIAYTLVATCYIGVGVLIFITFPHPKACLKDNFLNNIAADDMMTFVAHILLFFQMTCVLPLLTFILRSQLFTALYGTEWPSFKHVIVLNVLLFIICILFAIFLPHIGRIIGFVGAFCGLAYAIALPCCVYMKAQFINGTLTCPSLIAHSFLIVLGAANFIAQFLIIGKTS